MADRFDRPLRDEDPVDWDETVEDLPIDEASPDAPPPWGDDHELRTAALSQRFVDAALRARRDTTAAREARVAGILDALPEEPGRRGGLVAFGPWLSAAAAAALLALLVWSVLNQESGRSELEAAVLESAVKGIVHDDVDRLFEVDVSLRDDSTGVFERIGTHQLFTRRGGWFRLEFDGVLAQDAIWVCDSQKMWVRPAGKTKYEEIPDLDDLRAAIGGPLRDGGFFDAGYLRLPSVVSRLAGSGHLRYSRVVTGEGAAGGVRAPPRS